MSWYDATAARHKAAFDAASGRDWFTSGCQCAPCRCKRDEERRAVAARTRSKRRRRANRADRALTRYYDTEGRTGGPEDR